MCSESFATQSRCQNRFVITRLIELCGYEIVEKEYPVDTRNFTKEELEAFEKNPYRHIKIVLESHRQDRDVLYRILDNSEVERIFTDIVDFIEFTCSKHLKRPFSDYLSTRKGDM